MPRVMKQADIDRAIAKANPVPDPAAEKKARKPRKMMLGEYALLFMTEAGCVTEPEYTLIPLGVSEPSRVESVIKKAKDKRIMDGIQYQIIRLGPTFTAKRVTIEKTEIMYQ